MMIKQNVAPFIPTQNTVINESDINYVFESIYRINISNIPKSLVKGLGWIIESWTIILIFQGTTLSW